MALIACPFLKGEVELTEERERHIAEQHPDLLPEHRDCILMTLADPDQVRESARFANARMLSRWFEDLRGGKHVVVVVVGDAAPAGRQWVVTAYITRRLSGGGVVWQRS